MLEIENVCSFVPNLRQSRSRSPKPNPKPVLRDFAAFRVFYSQGYLRHGRFAFIGVFSVSLLKIKFYSIAKLDLLNGVVYVYILQYYRLFFPIKHQYLHTVLKN